MALGIAAVRNVPLNVEVLGTQRICLKVKSEKELVLVPTPSSDPNDPLRLSWGEKQSILWTVAVLSFVVSIFGPMVGTSYLQVSSELHKPLDPVVQALSGTFGMTVGLGALLTGALGTAYGKRPVFFFSLLLLIGMTFWCYRVRTLPMLAATRALQGLAASGIEIMASSVVVDLFFVHTRGRYLAIIGAVHGIGYLVSQIAGGFVVQHFGWRDLFSLSGFLLLALVLPVFFLLLETGFSRGDSIGGNESLPLTDMSHTKRVISASEVSIDPTIERKSYRQCLSVLSWRSLSPTPFWKLVVRPVVPLMVFPAVIFGTFVHGLGTVYLHCFGYAKLALFTKAPYSLTPTQIGLTALPGVVTNLLGYLIGGYASDMLVTRLSRRNDGMYEPEFRLWLMVPQTIFSTAGFIGFGYFVSHGSSLALVLASYASVGISIAFGSLASMTYLMDTMPIATVQEAIVSIVVLRSIFNFVAASKINGFIHHFGVEKVFFGLGMANLAVSLLTIPFYIFGKRLRYWSSTNKTLQKLL
ncbi:major facilitator superfamily domain-containing protein [Protomyces lactucae-debilis]|uniref:Major facilitator superfamily domain-containing protein n=1 Tax=Protomyces lactucae-debilis TaxID=2754530 RepID=A0A1Y2FUZ8_PROLT|nr:major facilitator superfamily domain-containing protein [Protomyces lactucae-debilis]ORY87822.1 major facilitator superfamily domain-containing protein [Protomyces lactucae-debilis]